MSKNIFESMEDDDFYSRVHSQMERERDKTEKERIRLERLEEEEEEQKECAKWGFNNSDEQIAEFMSGMGRSE